MASITQRFLVPVSTVSARNAWNNDPPFLTQNDKNARGVLPEKLGGDVRHASWNPYPISDQNPWFSLSYFRPDKKYLIPCFRPEALEPTAWPELVKSCYGTYTVVGVNIKREMQEMVLSPNDDEVANSSKKHPQFKTRVHKPYPISDQNSRNWYPISDQNGWKKTYLLVPHRPI